MKVVAYKDVYYTRMFHSPVEGPQCVGCGCPDVVIFGAVIEWNARRGHYEYMDGGDFTCDRCGEGRYEFYPKNQWMMFDNFFQQEDA